MASSSSSAFHGFAPSASTTVSKFIKKPSYDVFINHRGPDVKKTIAGTLHAMLTVGALSVFLDSEELKYGDFLPRIIEAAMASALVHIAIFSKGYAESPWCLAELSFILKSGAPIIPIFYHVEPTDLRWAYKGRGIYAEAFKDHEKKGRYSMDQLQEWKQALCTVSFYSGQIIKTNEDEMKLWKNIVPIVREKINEVTLVCEMGFSGKTTPAQELYNGNSSSKDRCSFISDDRDGATKGLLQTKQIQLLKHPGVQKVTFGNVEKGNKKIQYPGIQNETYGNVKIANVMSVRVLFFSYDVDHKDRLRPLKNNLPKGRLIINTTRDFKKNKIKYDRKELSRWHAFLGSDPPNGLEELVEKFVKVCNGSCWSIEVFGSPWEFFLSKISEMLPNDIQNIIKIGFDVLDVEDQKEFLEVAQSFIGKEISLVIEVWNGFAWRGLDGQQLLHNKSSQGVRVPSFCLLWGSGFVEQQRCSMVIKLF